MTNAAAGPDDERRGLAPMTKAATSGGGTRDLR
jgi:hypothetical protein